MDSRADQHRALLQSKAIISGPAVPITSHQDVWSKIEATATMHGTTTAIIHGTESITYDELMAKISIFRNNLLELGLAPGGGVAVALPRGIDYIVAVLATLATPAHFIPIRENTPPKRREAIIQNTGATILVGAHPTGELAQAAEHLGKQVFNQANLAYMMHTSGSTGQPKRVPVTRHALNNLLSWYGDKLALGLQSKMAQLSQPSFDLSIPEVFLPLMHGARMIIPTRTPAMGLLPLVEELIDSHVTIVQMVPTILRKLVDLSKVLPSLAERLQESLQVVVCNGETLPDLLRREFSLTLPSVDLVNSYGPTEACVAVTWNWCSKSQEMLPNTIGDVVPNVTIAIIGSESQLLEVGSVGEICIGGAQTSAGYSGDPLISDSPFLDWPVGNPNASLYYRTGDFGRLANDGTIEFIDRRDRQIKLRGVRVELGEIEAAIRLLGPCNDVRAVERRDELSGATMSVVCFVTPENVDPQEVLDGLQQVLPADRLPSMVLPLASLPASENGKVDDAALAHLVKTTISGRDDPDPDSHGDPRDALRAVQESIASVTGRLYDGEKEIAELRLDSLQRLEVEVGLATKGWSLPPSWVDSSSKARISELAATATAHLPVNVPSRRATFERELRRVFDYASQMPTDLLVVQSSLPDLNGVDPNDALELLLSEIDRLSTSITLALPSYTLSFAETHEFDVDSSRSESGVLATHAMLALGGLRTLHPAYSFVVLGPAAGRLATIPWHERSAFGDDSIFGVFSREAAAYVMIATRAVIHTHRCEAMAKVPYHAFRPVKGTMFVHGSSFDVETAIYERDIRGTDASKTLGFNVDLMYQTTSIPIVRFAGTSGDHSVVDSAALESALVPILESSPYRYVNCSNKTK